MTVQAALLFVLAGLAVVLVVRWVADRTGLPAAALLTVAGIGYAFLPGPNVALDPEVVLTFVLPPLLYSAALDSSLTAIRRNLPTVVSLSVALVLATALTIGIGFEWFVEGATLAVGIAVGAAVAPPDPVAALGVARTVGMPVKLVTLIRGEGLLNDATALTLLSVAVAAAAGGGFSAPVAVGQFVLAAAGGLLVGVVIAYGIRLLRRVARDPLTANALSLATPFVAYLIAENVHVSGVLAVVVTGLVVGHDAPRFASGESRLQTGAVWRLVDFLLEGFVFLLIGQQVPIILDGLRDYPMSVVAPAVLITVGVVLLLRPVWLIVTQSLPRSLHMQFGAEPVVDEDATVSRGSRWIADRLTGREVVALSWAGTRGVISLAAIFTLPTSTDSGAPFPVRDLLVFCTLIAVLVTLLGQGLTFGFVVRALGLRAGETDQARVRNEAREASAHAALVRLDELENEEPDSDLASVAATRARLRARVIRYQDRLDVLRDAHPDEVPASAGHESALRVRRATIDAQREELLRWRDAGRLPDESLRVLERELDHEERVTPDRHAH
ncbi:Na+/H+ antiporter [Cryptosporangium sp. NPDC048952]|uniref:Na+/H+ antiporter n=1 Tax=Cryptosporangium sp. NPDC048952 TaxID=3363961 RepID=UPI00371F2AEB